MKRILFPLLVISSLFLQAQDNKWTTCYERSGGKETPRYPEVVGFCKDLDKASPIVSYTAFGRSGEGRDLPLLILDKQGLTNPVDIRKNGRIILLVQACIHAGECEGKDAGLMLARDMAIYGKNKELLDHVSVLFIPIFNVDGHERFGPYNRINQNGPAEMGWRVNASNRNLNRDYLKADTPEMDAWLSLFNKWMPEFFIDSHTTDGADYQYTVTYGIEIHGNMEAGLTDWSKNIFLGQFTGGMEKAGYPIFPYIEFRNWSDLESGLTTAVSPPMLSQAYTAQRNRPGLLIETHMLKPYDQRVAATYQCFVTVLSILNREYKGLGEKEEAADRFTASREFRTTPFPLKYKTLENDSSMVDFLGFDYLRIKSDFVDQYYCKYGTKKTTYRLPYFNIVKPDVTVRLPEAYVIPQEWTDVIDRLTLHGISMHRLGKDTAVKVSSYKFSHYQWRTAPYEGRHPLIKFDEEEIAENRILRAGSVIVDMNQPCARIIAYLLEPQGDGSLLAWGFFDAVFEQKEYAELYVLEPMIKKMMADDTSLKADYEKKVAEDPSFAKDPQQIMRYFLNKTPYRDSRKDIYPVSRIMDPTLAASLLNR
jgi:hypothetical protein